MALAEIDIAEFVIAKQYRVISVSYVFLCNDMFTLKHGEIAVSAHECKRSMFSSQC